MQASKSKLPYLPYCTNINVPGCCSYSTTREVLAYFLKFKRFSEKCFVEKLERFRLCFPCNDVDREGSVQSNHPLLSHEFGVVRPYRTVSVWCARCLYILVRGGSSTSNLLEPHHYKVFRVLSHEFGVVRLYIPNLLYLHRCRGNKVCRVPYALVRGRVLSHEFGVVRLYRTFSIYIVARCSGWFKHIEPYRTFSNHIITEIAR